MYKDRDWISYDTIENIQKRAAYVVANNLGGLFVWSRMYLFHFHTHHSFSLLVFFSGYG